MKHIVTFSVCLAAILVSCTRIQETNVDFGSKTFVNEYKTLTDAVNDLRVAVTNQTTSLELKLAAIEAAIQAQTVEVKAGDELIRTAIETLDASVKAGIVSEQEALEQIKAAMDSQTSTLSTKLSAIEAAITIGFADIVTAEGLVSSAISSLSANVKTGFITEKQALDQIKQAVQSQTFALSTNLMLIKSSVDFGLMNVTVAEQMVKDEVYALKTSVDVGNVTEMYALDQIKQAVNSQTFTLSYNLMLIKSSIDLGLMNVTEAEKLVKDAVYALKASVDAGNFTEMYALDQIKQAVNGQTFTLNMKLSTIENAVRFGLGGVAWAEGQIKDAINTLDSDLNYKLIELLDAFNTNNEKLDEISDDLAGATGSGSSATVLGALNNINDALSRSLADGGLYFSGTGKQNSMYMSPEAWGSIMASSNQDMKNSVMDALNITVPTITAVQVQSTSVTDYSTLLSSASNLSSVHSYTIYSVDSSGNATKSTGGGNAGHLEVLYNGPDGSAHLYSNMLQGVESGIANGKPVVKVYKVCDYLKFEVYVTASGCATKKINSIVTKAAGGDYNIGNGNSLVVGGSSFGIDQGHVTFKLPCYTYNAATGVLDVLIDETNFFVLCNW